jgi:acetyl-CoA carboxylase biotin carboxyl carrier protein
MPELTQRTGTSDLSAAPEPAPDDRNRALREEIVELANALPGDLRRLTVRNGDRAIEVEWAADAVSSGDGSRRAVPESAPGAVGGCPGTAPDESPGPASDIPEGISAVRAPLVGTFYAAPSPGADPFVRVGDEVESGQTLGIVEAMKLMNPIVADEAGVVTEIFVGATQSVEYDQVLLHLRLRGRSR